MSYCPGLEPLIIRVDRDKDFIQKLSKGMDKFCEELEEVCKQLKPAKGSHKGGKHVKNTF